MAEVLATNANEAAAVISKLVDLRGPLQSVSKERADTAEYRAAFAAYDAALRATVLYMGRVKSGKEPYDEGKEFELSQLWSDASVAVSAFDPGLANRCFIKGQGWMNPEVWEDERYKDYRIGIDDMREALMEFNEKQFNDRKQRVPDWFPIAGLCFAMATFASLFYLLLGPDLTPQKKIIFNTWMAFCVAASGAFIGGAATANGTLKIPFMKDAPVKFSTIGGIAIFIVVFLLMAAANR